MIVGAYSLDLYCDNEKYKHPFGYMPHQYVGETYAECVREARRDGWLISNDRQKCLCPKCSGKRKANT